MMQTGEPKPLALRTVGEIVADDYRTASVFSRNGIDFCCGGKSTLAAACARKGVNPSSLLLEIESVKNAPADQSQNYGAWSPSFLADYIVNVHHGYIRENVGQIAGYVRKIAEVHGPRHPELVEIAALFDKISTDMAAHLTEEEQAFLPAVKRVEAERGDGRTPEAGDLAAIERMLETLGRDHDQIGEAVHRIRHLSNGFAIPDDACNTLRVAYRKLEEFEEDLHKHVHLENNILFSRAARLILPDSSAESPGE